MPAASMTSAPTCARPHPDDIRWSRNRGREWLENHGRSDLAGSLLKNGRIFIGIEIDSPCFIASMLPPKPPE
jgi:hypothetical protein